MKNIDFMLKFVKSYIDGNIERWELELDFDAEPIKRYPKMEKEHRKFTEIFCDCISGALDDSKDLSDTEFYEITKAAYDDVIHISKGGFC